MIFGGNVLRELTGRREWELIPPVCANDPEGNRASPPADTAEYGPTKNIPRVRPCAQRTSGVKRGGGQPRVVVDDNLQPFVSRLPDDGLPRAASIVGVVRPVPRWLARICKLRERAQHRAQIC